MATVDLSKAKSLDEIAYLWAKFVLQELMTRRERQEAAIPSCLFTFESDGVTPRLPVFPTAVLGTPPEIVAAQKAIHDDTYAYLVVVPGVPIPVAAWDGESPSLSTQERAEIPIGVPTDLIAFDRPYIWWLTAIFVSPTIRATFCAGFTGEEFSPLREIAGTHGGAFSALGPRAVDEA